jgi:hypothetical protein
MVFFFNFTVHSSVRILSRWTLDVNIVESKGKLGFQMSKDSVTEEKKIATSKDDI